MFVKTLPEALNELILTKKISLYNRDKKPNAKGEVKQEKEL